MYLCTQLDYTLDITVHWTFIIPSIKLMTHMITKRRLFAGYSVHVRILYGSVSSWFLYASFPTIQSCWEGASGKRATLEKDLDASVQNVSVQAILGTQTVAHARPLLHELHWAPVCFHGTRKLQNYRTTESTSPHHISPSYPVRQGRYIADPVS